MQIPAPDRAPAAPAVRLACQLAAIVLPLVAAALLAFQPRPSVSAAPSTTLPSGFAESLVASGLPESPTLLRFSPDGRLFVAQQAGKLYVVRNGAPLATPFLSLDVDTLNERGLIGLAFDPDFATNRYVYVHYTAKTPTLHNRISRFTASAANPDVADPGSEYVVMELETLGAGYHNGGALTFGPDGKLYVSVGDNTIGTNAQSMTTRKGKVLRINKDGSIPTDNPFYGSASGDNRAIFALGFRNPYTLAVQPGTGRLYVNDVGQDAYEEINNITAGSNYGWPTTEGYTTDPRFVSPVFAYSHVLGDSGGCAITGGAFYNPSSPTFPAQYVGKYFFIDFCREWIKVLDPASGSVSIFANGVLGVPSSSSTLVGMEVGPDGALYWINRTAKSVYRIQYTGIQAPQIGQQPADITVPAGRPATFTIRASGEPTLAYQWQKNGVNIPGATGPSYTVASPTLADSGTQYRCIVTNAFGSATSNAATLTVTPNQAPTGTITAPSESTTYAAGDTIAYTGTATDPEDCGLPATAYTWKVDFHHDTHSHPFITPFSGVTGGSFTIPTTGEASTNVWYRITLTARDSGGLTHTTFRDVRPRTSTITLATDPPGLQVTLDGQPQTGPSQILNVVGMTRSLGVVSPQTVNGTTYEFDVWSDGGAATHNITVPPTDATYTARYRIVAGPTPGTPPLSASYTSNPPTDWTSFQTRTYSITVTNTGSQTWNASGTNRVVLGVHFGTASDLPNDGWATDERFLLPADVAPGQSATLNVIVTAPGAGQYVLRHRMYKENVAWFDQIQRTYVTVAAPALLAQYSSSPPTNWVVGQPQTYPITITNLGTQTWNASGNNLVRLGVHFGTDSDVPGVGWATDLRFPLPNDVAPGASVTMTVTIDPPSGTGNYVLRHRMVKEGIAWFDQLQKTNVTVSAGLPTATPTPTVVATATPTATAVVTVTPTATTGAPLAATYSSSPPTAWGTAETKSYSITVTNTGSQTWNASGNNLVRLGVHFGGLSDWPHEGWATDQRFALPNDVAPGQSVTMTVQVTSPNSAGPYTLRHRMVKEGIAWFDQLQKTNVTVSAGLPTATPTPTVVATATPTATTGAPLAATYSSSPPTAWGTAETKSYSITVTNTGSQTWSASGTTRVRLGVHFGGLSDWPHEGWATDQRFALPNDVAPGQSITLTVGVTAPTTAGGYVLRHRMVKENVAWFGQLQKTDVVVSSAPTATPTATSIPSTATPTATTVPPTATATRTTTATATATPAPLAASYASSPPTAWTTRQTQTYQITITNTGSQAWNAKGNNRVRLGVHFGGASDTPNVGWATDQRFALPNDVAPGQSVTMTVQVTSPNSAGPYTLRHRMVKENVAWFNQIQKTTVQVSAT